MAATVSFFGDRQDQDVPGLSVADDHLGRARCHDLDSAAKFRLCSLMGGKDPNRQPRVGSIRETPPGWLRLLTCNTCAHRGVLPAERLLRKHGELTLLEFALVSVRCTACGARGATMTMVRLCDPGCSRWS